jgi:hypothetical protein
MDVDAFPLEAIPASHIHRVNVTGVEFWESVLKYNPDILNPLAVHGLLAQVSKATKDGALGYWLQAIGWNWWPGRDVSLAVLPRPLQETVVLGSVTPDGNGAINPPWWWIDTEYDDQNASPDTGEWIFRATQDTTVEAPVAFWGF